MSRLRAGTEVMPLVITIARILNLSCELSVQPVRLGFRSSETTSHNYSRSHASHVDPKQSCTSALTYTAKSKSGRRTSTTGQKVYCRGAGHEIVTWSPQNTSTSCTSLQPQILPLLPMHDTSLLQREACVLTNVTLFQADAAKKSHLKVPVKNGLVTKRLKPHPPSPLTNKHITMALTAKQPMCHKANDNQRMQPKTVKIISETAQNCSS